MTRKALLPLVPLYRLALAARELRLRKGWEPVEKLDFPVISIGNLSTGGAGKTPLTIALAQALTRKGLQVDVLSRGYGRKSSLPLRVDPDGSAEEFGDEPLLIARDAGVPVYVAPRRFDAGQLAERNSARLDTFPEMPASGAKALPDSTESAARLKPCPDASCTFSPALLAPVESDPCGQRVHLLDDGFQHRQLFREADILLVNRQDWQDCLLPAGNLREPLAAIHRASVVAIPTYDPDLEAGLRTWGWHGPVWRLRRSMEIPPVEGPAIAFCGIARPQQFFAGLEANGLRLAGKAAFRDHYPYRPSDLDRLAGWARRANVAALVTTEKDRIRLGTLVSSLPDGLRLLSARLTIELEREDESMEWLLQKLKRAQSCPAL